MNIPAFSGEHNEILEHEETMELIKKAQKGDMQAQEILVSHNLGLVRSMINRFANRGYEREDLFQLGCIGLIKAIKKFDASYDVKFSTYAVPMIVGEIKRFLRDDGIIKVSRNLKQTASKVKMVKEKLFKEFGREATLQEIADELNIEKEDIVLALDSNAHPEYLYDVIHHDDGAPIYLIDKITKDESLNDTEVIDRLLLQDTLAKLEPRERQIILLRYFKDKTQTEIAETLGISQVQVSRIEKKVLQSMKELMKKA
ncbi:RNA polymerase sporulation sigma factor SigF [Clostridium formicaceticum]|uniref:RNA polymerase sigma factor n=1 Tax=Clostridium formicaceticum TaxID=1497 RepID=A0AAC9RMY2_9CLOT|nr:RNA polymerase sporulation sigma factor SigF [Clostridium formicaceticum]AOY76762.1 RNA polymerase sigma-F factor [Clostridium formicaceticum]ARE87215.1 RNA polymerase sigma-F factor [Clostridium formicaceticum]